MITELKNQRAARTRLQRRAGRRQTGADGAAPPAGDTQKERCSAGQSKRELTRQTVPWSRIFSRCATSRDARGRATGSCERILLYPRRRTYSRVAQRSRSRRPFATASATARTERLDVRKLDAPRSQSGAVARFPQTTIIWGMSTFS